MMPIIPWGMRGGAIEGEVIQSYRLDHLIAEGGMGAVWAATHTSLGRRAAVKLLAPRLAENREYVSRFLSEARIVNDVRHPNIVDIFDFVELEGPRRVACIMELLEGPTLAELVKRGPLDPERALQVTLQLVDALVQVHAAGVVHRDLKPQNIIVVAPLDSDFSLVPAVKILDFGIAKQDTRSEHKTATGSIMGTPADMAPEQVAAAEVSGATDLYALAEILFEMLTGARLYRGDNLAILRQKISSEAPTLKMPGHVRDADRLVALLRACLVAEPTSRPGLTDFGAALGSLLEEWGEQPTPVMPQALDGLEAEPAANTQMFYERILEDIDEVRPQREPPPAVTEPEPEPDLQLDAPPVGHGYGVTGPARAAAGGGPRVVSERRRAPSSASTPIPVIQGKKERPPRRLWPWLVALVALAGIVGVLATPRIRNQAQAQMDLLSAPPLVQEATARWQREFAPFTGSAQDFLQQAAKAQLEDAPQGYRRAREHLRKALILDPESPEAIARYVENEGLGFADTLASADRGELLAWLEGLQDAEGAARRAEALISFDPERRATLSQAMLRSPAAPDRLTAAALLYAEEPASALEALTMENLPPRAVRLRAEAELARGHFHAARAAIAPRLKAEPDNRLLLELDGRILERVGELELAERRLAAATKADPEHLPTALAHGRLAARRGHIAEAATSLSRVAEPADAPATLRAEAYTEWARLAMAQRAWPIVAERAKEAVELTPGAPEGVLLLIEALVQQGKPLAAQEVADHARAANVTSPSLDAHAAALALERDLVAETLAAIERARRLDPGDPRLAAVAAALVAAAGDPARAKVHAEHLLALDPHHALHHDHIAEMMPSTLQIAKERLRREASTRARALEGVLAYLGGDLRDAQASLRAAKDDPVARVYLAQLELDRGNTGRAQRALKGLESAPAARLVAGRVAARRGQKKTAGAAYAEAQAAQALVRAAKVESAALAGEPEPLRARLEEHRDDPWLRAQLYAAEAR